jgi:hypothetical protein
MESAKISITLVTSLIVGAVAMTLISTEIIPLIATTFVIPIVAYLVSIMMSVIYQYSACKKVTIIPILITDLAIAFTTITASLILLFETVPILKYMFNPYPPRNPVTGLQYTKGTAEYDAGMLNENHYKIQFFSNIVKAVIPVYVDENVKEGFVYLYWIFWMTFLPQYFTLSAQGIC